MHWQSNSGSLSIAHSWQHHLKEENCSETTTKYMDMFKIHKSVHRQYIRRVQPTSCKVSQFIYFCKTLYMFQTGFPSIIRSSKLHLQHQVFLRPVPDAICAVLSSDDGQKTRLKHVERLTEIKKLWNVASAWLYYENMRNVDMYVM